MATLSGEDFIEKAILVEKLLPLPMASYTFHPFLFGQIHKPN
jgi:hypothetical protein